MGVDACVFSKKAKKYIYIDRYTNATLWYSVDEYENSVGTCLLEKLCAIAEELKYGDGISAEQLQELSNHNISAAHISERIGSDYYPNLMLNFAKAFPDDIFFLITDHQDPPYYDYVKQYRDGLLDNTYYTTGLPLDEEYAYEEWKVEE